ncbi:MAG: hypothetical protein ACRD9S_14315 [Pyrinomonadaceae bacterium]
MNWNWDTNRWRRSWKVLLGLATVWPAIYMVLFLVTVFSFVLLIPFEDHRGSSRKTEDIDLIQLERKIDNGEIGELRVTAREIIAVDRVRGVEYYTSLTNGSTREEILKGAREVDSNGQPRVAKIDEDTSQPPSGFLPIGFAALFVAHFITILLILGLMPLYIVLVVKSDRLDQTMRIIWVVLICMLGMFAMPVYWYLYVWRNAPPISAEIPS